MTDWSQWPDADIKMAKAMWRDGSSYQQIADAIPGRSRSAVCGLIKRLGLQRHDHRHSEAKATAMQRRKEREKSQPKPPTPVAVSVLGHEPFRFPNGDFVTLETVSDKTCRMPVGDPGTDSFHYCGQPPKAGKPYCESCCKRAYIPINAAARVSDQDKAVIAANARKTGLDRMFG